jgi:hypothetical protein
MTEAEWLACEDPQQLLEVVREKASERKLRLYACGSVRRHQQTFESDRINQVVDVAERFADGMASEQERIAAHREAGHLICPDAPDIYCITWYALENPEHLLGDLVGVSSYELGRPGSSVQLWSDMRSVLLDLFGNPFRPITPNPSWLTPTVTSLAQGIYEDRAFDRLPILADALEDAGCTNADILEHCRGPGPHVRGCWVVDLLLDKS